MFLIVSIQTHAASISGCINIVSLKYRHHGQEGYIEYTAARFSTLLLEVENK